MSQIIIAKEDDITRYYPASTPEELGKSALSILTRRWNDGYSYIDPDDDGLGDTDWAKEQRVEIAKALVMTEEQIAILPKEAAYAVKRIRSDAKKDSASDRIYRNWYENAKKVVEAQDDGFITLKSGKKEPKAWRLLCDRADHEYEYVTLEDLEEV